MSCVFSDKQIILIEIIDSVYTSLEENIFKRSNTSTNSIRMGEIIATHSLTSSHFCRSAVIGCDPCERKFVLLRSIS
jgi:hypothetical protein